MFNEDDEENSFARLKKNTKKNMRNDKKNKSMKIRFSDEQIKSLETVFDSDTKLDPRKKLQMAIELGLQPRQVAIWFQNRRARWKSKQLERDYSLLQGNYTNLSTLFEALKKQNQALTLQIQKLKDLVQNPHEDLERNYNEGDSLNYEEIKLCLDRMENEVGVVENEDITKRVEYFGMDKEPELLTMVEQGNGSLTSSEDWGNFDNGCLFDKSSSSSQWWNFWS